VQDIAQRAKVNRATFYDHFEDKYAILDTCILEGFQRLVASRLSPSSSLNEHTLRLLILTLLEYLAMMHTECKPSDKQVEPRFETTVQKALYHLLLNWLKKLPPSALHRRVPLETLASTISWAIFGAGIQWDYEGQTCSPQEMTDHILTVMSDGLFQIIRVHTQE